MVSYVIPPIEWYFQASPSILPCKIEKSVPVRYILFTGTVPVRYALFTGTVPVRYALFTGTVPVNNLFQYWKQNF